MDLREYIQKKHNGNKYRAAKALNLNYCMIWRYLNRGTVPARKKAREAFRREGIDIVKIS